MSSVYPNIKPTGILQKDEVDFWCMVFRALKALCDKLDADDLAGLDDDYWDTIGALISFAISDSKGNTFRKQSDLSSSMYDFFMVSQTGITDQQRVLLLYTFWNCWETLCEKMDADALTLADYEAYSFTAVCTHKVKDQRGNSSGRGTVFTFSSNSVPRRQYVDALYQVAKAFYAICYGDGATYGLDNDGGANLDTDYTSSIYTTYFTLMIENSEGDQIGASR